MIKVKITEVCEIQVGKTPSRSNPSYWGDGYPWLSIADMSKGQLLEKTKETITEKAVKECNCKLIPIGTVLFSFKLSIGKVGITKIPMYTNEAIAAFMIKDHSLLDTKFLLYVLKSVDHSIGSNKAVMGRTLNKENLKKIEIPLLSLKEQKRIVQILDKANSLRQKRKQVILHLEDYLKSIFLEMFGDPITNTKPWRTTEFSNLCSKIFGGGTPSKSKPEFYEGPIPWVTPKDMKRRYISDSEDHISNDAVENSSVNLIPTNSILMVIRSGILKNK